MKRYYIYLLLCLCIISCNSQENQAYKDAIASNNMAALRNYLSAFDGNMSKKHHEKAASALDVLILDSVYYDKFLAAEDTIKKYNVCRQFKEQNINGPHSLELNSFETSKRDYYYEIETQRFGEIDNMDASFKSYNMFLKYLAEFPYGQNVEKAKAFLEHNKNVHEQMTSKINSLKKVFSNYKFDGYDISGPDEYGEGEFTKKIVEREDFNTFNGPEQHLYYRDYEWVYSVTVVPTRTFKGKYYVDEDLLLHVDITESCSFSGLVAKDLRKDYARVKLSKSQEKEFISYFKKKKIYLNKEHHLVCKLITYSEGNYDLRVQESGHEIVYYDGILK